MFKNFVLFFVLGISISQANLITNSGFETDSIGTNYGTSGYFDATRLNRWSVDPLLVAGAENGITPLEGSQMGHAGGGGGSTDAYYLIDLSSYADAIAAQTAEADLSAFFNASTSVPIIGVSLRAWSIDLPFWFNTDLNVQTNWFSSDSNTSTWEEATIEDYLIPLGAKYLAVGVHLSTSNHVYVDNVNLTISGSPVPEPMTVTLMGLGLGGLVLARRKRKTA